MLQHSVLVVHEKYRDTSAFVHELDLLGKIGDPLDLTIRLATNPGAALTVAEQIRPDAIVVHPLIRDSSLCSRLKESSPNSIVYGLTDSEAQDVLGQYVDPDLPKPNGIFDVATGDVRDFASSVVSYLEGMKPVFLNLREVSLYGWEEYKSDRVIRSIMEGIAAGDNFPAVNVFKIDDETYELAGTYLHYPDSRDEHRLEGGHYRALGHFAANAPLECKVLGEKDRTETSRVQDIKLVDDRFIDGEGRYRAPNDPSIIIPVASFAIVTGRDVKNRYRQ
tara:strand:- start:2223 stop:3056 length:834 start_codon:yes stop_codon:yes gene_type:complete